MVQGRCGCGASRTGEGAMWLWSKAARGRGRRRRQQGAARQEQQAAARQEQWRGAAGAARGEGAARRGCRGAGGCRGGAQCGCRGTRRRDAAVGGRWRRDGRNNGDAVGIFGEDAKEDRRQSSRVWVGLKNKSVRLSRTPTLLS
jgi:hypothetical protein